MDELRTSLRAARLERGWSQRELARRADVSQTAVSALECGIGSTVDTLARIVDAFGLSLVMIPRRSNPKLRPCGTPAALARHRANGEPTCAACKAWERERGRRRRQVRAGSTSQACGMVAV